MRSVEPPLWVREGGKPEPQVVSVSKDEVVGVPVRAGKQYPSIDGNGHAPLPVISRRFRDELGSVRQARQFASEFSASLNSHQASVLVLLVSELATNCIKHSYGGFEVTIDVDDRIARVEVKDNGPGQPEIRKPNIDDLSGRGLLVVQALSDDWGVVPDETGNGKTVWFLMSLA